MQNKSMIRAIWLDPTTQLGNKEAEALVNSGVAAIPVNTFDELKDVLSSVRCVVIKLVQSTELLKEAQKLIAGFGGDSPVICRVNRRDIDLAVNAMRDGASYVVCADDWSERSWSEAMASLPQKGTSNDSSAVFVDPISQHLLALAQRVAQTDVTALLVGPTGAGKEVLARVLHESSPRAKGPFVALNCAALPENLIEDLLFGHEKGAFTGALREHKGLFEQAQGGTIFLDEIGEMPLALQAKLLRVLQERRLMRLGGQSQIALDVRVVAATNKDLKQAIANREFREDLYFRISTFRLTLSPLAQRPGDILPLVATILAEHGQPSVAYQLLPDAEAALLQYPWPGNVRELSNVVQRAMVLCPDGRIGVAHLLFDEPLTAAPNATTLDLAPAPVVPELTPHEPAAPTPPSPWASAQPTVAPAASTTATTLSEAHGPLSASVRHTELQAILTALRSTDSRTEAAKQLGISPRTLRYKIAQLRQQGAPLGLMNA